MVTIEQFVHCRPAQDRALASLVADTSVWLVSN
jgi:hypothetical protein